MLICLFYVLLVLCCLFGLSIRCAVHSHCYFVYLDCVFVVLFTLIAILLFGLCIRCAVDSYCYLTFNANFIHHFRQYVWFIHQVTSTMIHGIIPVSFQLKCYFVYFMFYWCYFVYLFLIVYLYCVFVMLLTLIVIWRSMLTSDIMYGRHHELVYSSCDSIAMIYGIVPT